METQGGTFLVTGGGSGLGAAVAGNLAEGGANVVVADLEGENNENVRFIETDVADEESVQDAIDATLEFGELRSVINCAGVATAEKILGKEGPHALDLFNKVVQVNLIGTFNVARLGGRHEGERADGGRGARRHRQHCLGRGVRGPDRAGCLRRFEGWRRLPDPAPGA